MVEAAGWALVAGCLMVTGPDCSGYLATGLVWGDRDKCVTEMRKENIPGAQCMEIVGVVNADDVPEVVALDKVIRQLDEEVKSGKH